MQAAIEWSDHSFIDEPALPLMFTGKCSHPLATSTVN